MSGRWVDVVADAVHERVVGQNEAVEGLLTGVLIGGHVLLEGQPGLAKTLMVRALAEVLGIGFRRIQFTPDLLPADLTGTQVLEIGTSRFSVRKGPIFANLVLADEINRAPPKVQSALLEAMEEHQVTLAGETYRLEEPFLVLATQNPYESQGTYPLAEAQLDRFAMKIEMHPPSRDEEIRIVERVCGGPLPPLPVAGTVERILQARAEAAAVHVDRRILEYAVDLVCATRRPRDFGLADLEGALEFGASPRATIWLVRAARAHAYLQGRDFVSPDDIKRIVGPVLRHRLRIAYDADLRGVAPDQVLQRVLQGLRAP